MKRDLSHGPPTTPTGIWRCGPFRLNYKKRPRVMGILNVTPDSFSDGGRYTTPRRAVDHALRMAAAGADLIDIGGESTRPGATVISEADELRRVLPVIEKLAGRLSIPISIDTTRAEVARAALAAGAVVVNDVRGGLGDPAMLGVVAESDAGWVIMHCRGTPQTMQRAPRYHNLLDEVRQFLEQQCHRAIAAGIGRNRIVVDPGIGFGKTTRHNLTLLARLDAFADLGVPILVGPSRKSFIGKVLGGRAVDDPAARASGTAAVLAVAILRGARIVRVHDVAEAVDVVRVADAIQREAFPPLPSRERVGVRVVQGT